MSELMTPKPISDLYHLFYLKESAISAPVHIHISGASGAGKTTISNQLAGFTKDGGILPMDRYMKGTDYVNKLQEEARQQSSPFYGWDDLRNFNIEAIEHGLAQLKRREEIQIPTFDRKTGRQSRTESFMPKDTLIVEGIHALHPALTQFADLKIFIDAPLHDRLIRRIIRNHLGYGLGPVQDIISNYVLRVEPSFQRFGAEYSQIADHVISNPCVPERDFKQYAQEFLPSPDEMEEGGHLYRLEPFQQFGHIHKTERLLISELSDAQCNLSYFVQNQRLIKAKVDPNVVELLTKFYTFNSSN